MPRKFQTGETSYSPRKIIARLRSISAQHCCFSHLPMRLSSTQSALAPLIFGATAPNQPLFHKKRPFSGLFPSTILHRQVHIRNMLPHGGIRRLIISALNRFDNLPMQLNRHINDSGVLRQRFTHCQTNPVFKGIL